MVMAAGGGGGVGSARPEPASEGLAAAIMQSGAASSSSVPNGRRKRTGPYRSHVKAHSLPLPVERARPPIGELSFEQLGKWLQERGEAPYRAR
jgi:hypothetical protein